MEESENPFLNPFDLFVSESCHLDLEVRLNCAKKLSTIAVALDTERTQNELMPYLDTISEGLWNDDEVLLILAEELRNFIPFVGGPENAYLVLNILEKLAAIEENIVRSKTVESLEKIAASLDTTNLINTFIPLINRLANAEWFTSKCSATALFWVCYERSDVEIKADLRNLYRVLCQDESPLVRRSAAAKLTKFVDVLEINYLKDDFIPVFDNFSKDEQDSVRVLAIDVGVSITLRLKPKEIEDYILPTLTQLSVDDSWRVRYQLANQITAIQIAIGSELTRKHLITIYHNLAHDTEPQVREVSAKNIVRFCQILQQTYLEKSDLKGDNGTDPIILDHILPLVHLLYEDTNPEVKEGLSSVVTMLSPILGIEQTKQLLLPLITQSLINDSSRVKENIIANLNSIISVIGIADIAETILKIIIDLVNSSASVWRTRRNLLVTINYIANYLGQEYFDTHLKSLYIKLLSDGVYAVRKTAPLILPILVKKFGEPWASKSIIPAILLFSEHKHYLYRFVCLFCIDELIEPTLEVDSGDTKGYFKELQQLKDPNESNSNEAAKVLYKISILNQNLKLKLEERWVENCIKLLADYDTVDDIENYAEETIGMFKKDAQLKLMTVSQDEIYLPKTSYLEGVLKMTLKMFLLIVNSLAKDPTANVQINAAKTLRKIQNFNKSLEGEIQEGWIKEILEEKKEFLTEWFESLDEKFVIDVIVDKCDIEMSNNGDDEDMKEEPQTCTIEIIDEDEFEETSKKQIIDEAVSMETELIGILEEKLNTKPQSSSNEN